MQGHSDSRAPARTDPQTPVRCPLCGHRFAPGDIGGSVYCTKCGRQFYPYSFMEDTVALGLEGDGGESVAPAPSAEAPPAQEANPLGTRFGDYEILEEVARGGMGVIYRARHRVLKRVVALKVLRAREGATDEDIERFMREAKAAASLQHPNIVPIHELDVFKGQHFFTMDFIEGVPLDRLLEQGPLAPHRACDLIARVARAVHYAHTHGIIHRDIKPANIILDNGERPMITDFGLAVNLSGDEQTQRMTRTGAVMGTLPYIPPEQAGGKIEEVGPRSDVYALGAVFYEMLTGRPPFIGETQFELLRRIIHQDPLPPRSLNPRIHPDVQTICMKCLDKQSQRRYADAEALAEDCEAFIQGEMIQARPATLLYRLRRRIETRPALFGLCASVVVLGLALLVHMRLATREKEQMERVLQETGDKAERVKQEKQEIEARVSRNWRREFACDFKDNFPATISWHNARNTNRGWFDRDRAVVDRKAGQMILEGTDKSDLERAVFGFPMQLPFDYRLELRVHLPENDPATLQLLSGIGQNYLVRPTSRIVWLGVPGSPGARILRNQTTVAENSGFVLTPGRTHRVELVRRMEEPLLSVSVDGETVLEDAAAYDTADAAATHLGLSAHDGNLVLLEANLYVLGLSREMISTLLEVGDSLVVQKERALAQKLYERVLREKTQRAVHLRAYSGFVHAFSRSPRKLEESCRNLIASIRTNKSRSVEAGELEYLLGLAYAALNDEKALYFYQQAFEAAKPGVTDVFENEETRVIGPFEGRGGLLKTHPPEHDFNLDAVYTGKAGEVRWRPEDEPDEYGRVYLAPNPPSYSTWYIRRVYTTAHALRLALQARSDDGLIVWVNGEKALERNEKRSLDEEHVTIPVNFVKGRNVVLLKVHNMHGQAGYQLTAKALEVPPQLIGAYGLLARLESALMQLNLHDPTGARGLLSTMLQDSSMEILATRFRAEVRARGVTAKVLEHVDRLLATERGVAHAWVLLEAMRVLDPAAGRKLALRYHKLAEVETGAERPAEAEEALKQAALLAPEWHLPRFDRAVLLYRTERTEEAEQQFLDATEALPDSLELQLSIAGFYLHDESPARPAQALPATSAAVKLSEGQSPEALTLHAEALYATGRYGEALEAIEAAVALETNAEREALRRSIRSVLNMTIVPAAAEGE